MFCATRTFPEKLSMAAPQRVDARAMQMPGGEPAMLPSQMESTTPSVRMTRDSTSKPVGTCMAVSVLSALCLSGRCQYLWQGHAAAWGRACNATFPDGQYHSQCQNGQQQHLKPCQHLHAILCVSHAPVGKRCGADALRASLQCCLP